MFDSKIRLRLEEAENSLSIYASKSKLSHGRCRAEESSPVRTEFQRDRDRILYSNAFRRLKHKTQVFIAPLGDHYITRLTHTLEVAQIARTISRALNFNEDLTEAIALGHDLGHTPFGHLGEDVLNELNPEGFRHYEQSLRIVDCLEKNGEGLNLTWEVRDGIVNHSKSHAAIFADGWGETGTIEGRVVKIADIVAYINHDTNDAIRAGLLKESDIPEDVIKVLGVTTSNRINTLIMDIVKTTGDKLAGERQANPDIEMSGNVLEAANMLRDYLFANVYSADLTGNEKKKARSILTGLYKYFLKTPAGLPADILSMNDGLDRKVTDYIAGMTDQYALAKYEEIFEKKEIRKNPFGMN
jgi:dGTPase